MKSNKKAFTVVELVVVIAIIAILAAVLIPTFANILNKANVSKDTQLIRNLNTALTSDRASNNNKPHQTLYDALQAAEAFGYDVGKINASALGNEILWDQENDVFCYLDGTNVVYLPELVDMSKRLSIDPEVNPHHLWKIFDDDDPFIGDGKNPHGFSIYWNGSALEDTVELDGIGFDAGTSNVSKISYSTTETKNVVIRTNGGTLTIDAENDTVKHFGAAQVVTLTAVGTNSYYENGPVKQINIKKGRLIITNNEDTSIDTIYLLATGDTYDNIILATQNGAKLPSYIARDSVGEPESGAKLVVTIQSNVNEQGQNPEKTESIFLYPAKDVKEENNGYDVTDLGLLVVEAVSSDAQAEAAEAITDPESLEKVKATKADCVAIIDSIGYATFAAAWNAGTNKTVTLLKDVSLNGIPVVSTKTVDLNQHSLTIKGASLGDGQECGIWICCDWGSGYDGKLTLKNGTLNLPGTNYNKYGIYCYGSLLNCQNLKIESSCTETIHFEGHQYGKNYTSELNNVTINSSGTGIQSNGYKGGFFGNVIPTVNISNSKISSQNGGAFAINGSKANVSNSTFTPAAGQKSLFVYSNGTASGLAPELTLTGTVVCNGDSDYNKLAKNAGTVTIKEGTYNFNPTSYVDGEIYSIIKKDNTWTVAIK